MDPVRASRLPVRWLTLWAGVLLSLVLTGCASTFERRYDEAEQLRLQAAAKGYEWIGTADLLEQAAEEAEAGNTEAALALTEEARFQSEAALQQAEREADAWRRRVVK